MRKPNIVTARDLIIQGFGLGNVATAIAYTKTIPNISKSQTQDTAKFGKSALGTLLWDTLIFCPNGTFTYTDPISEATVKVPKLQLDTVLININRPTRIKATDVQGRDNDVIEYIGKGNWEINIKGGIYGNVNQRPKDAIATLDLLENAKIDIPVVSNVLSEHGISTIVIKKIHYPPDEGGYSFQRFEIEATSDVPFVIASTGANIINSIAANSTA